MPRHVVVTDVNFSFDAPEYAALARDIFGCTVRYGQDWTGYRAPIENLVLPLKLADPTAFEVAEMICQRELDRLAESETLAARVRRLLIGKQYGFPSLQVTARFFTFIYRCQIEVTCSILCNSCRTTMLISDK